MASQSPLFQPLRIRNVTLSHRVVMAPLTRLRADTKHVQLPMAATYHEQRASMPGTLLISETTIISPQHGGYPHAPGIWSSEQVAAWKKFVAVGRVADPATLKADGGYEVTAPSAIPLDAENGVVQKELTEEDIQGLIQRFETAAKSAIAAGFDGVEVHGANGYLVDQFLQDVTNKRTDSWGGSIPNRARFGLEVAWALVEAVGADRVGFRLSPWNTWQGMKMADPVPQFSYLAMKLKELKLAYLHVIESRVINNIDCDKTEGIEFLLEVWGKTSPVLVAGGYNPANAETAFAEYKMNDIAVVFGRHFIANPDLPFRIREGLPLNKYDRDSFYAFMQAAGYTDYPFSKEFLGVKN
ncbi:hypothetical protein BDW67DRAFT_192252 [Aspergillus spinulosporus]